MRFIYVDESGISINESVTVVAGVVVKGDKEWRAVERHVKGLIDNMFMRKIVNGFSFTPPTSTAEVEKFSAIETNILSNDLTRS